MSARPHRKAPSKKTRATPQLVSSHAGKPTHKPTKPSILVVDDDLDARTMYGVYLKSMGCTVYTATDGAGAIKQALALHPDLIVLDLAMPHVDGWQAAERLRRAPSTRAIPIIALTAIPGARESARLSGCDAFMAKPCLPQLLWCEVRLLLGIEGSEPKNDEDDAQAKAMTS
jgi:two-component system, cell cycle response regulator DivK